MYRKNPLLALMYHRKPKPFTRARMDRASKPRFFVPSERQQARTLMPQSHHYIYQSSRKTVAPAYDRLKGLAGHVIPLMGLVESLPKRQVLQRIWPHNSADGLVELKSEMRKFSDAGQTTPMMGWLKRYWNEIFSRKGGHTTPTMG